MASTLIALIALTICQSTISVSIHRVKRYVNAKNSKPFDWPWMVLVRNGLSDGDICGGTLLNSDWVLTAAHCLDKVGDVHHTDYKVVFLEHDRLEPDDSKLIIGVEDIVKHPEYETTNHSFDVGLIKMKESLDTQWFDSHKWLKPVCLSFFGSEEFGDECYGTGWGLIGKGKLLAHKLKELPMKRFDTVKCAAMYEKEFQGPNYERITEKQICMQSDQEETKKPGAACKGDSGGPLNCFIADKWRQVGITWSVPGCHSGVTGFNLVHPYLEWIQAVTAYTLPSRCENVTPLTTTTTITTTTTTTTTTARSTSIRTKAIVGRSLSNGGLARTRLTSKSKSKLKLRSFFRKVKKVRLFQTS